MCDGNVCVRVCVCVCVCDKRFMSVDSVFQLGKSPRGGGGGGGGGGQKQIGRYFGGCTYMSMYSEQHLIMKG